MPNTIKTTFQLKRGLLSRWEMINPILAAGEPGWASDVGILKIGDGITPWNDLPYIDGKREIVNFDYAEEFPVIGDKNIIYKAEKEQSLYQFNTDTYKYEKLSDGEVRNLIIAEEARAKKAESDLAFKIEKTNVAVAAINDKDTGILVNANKYTDNAIAGLPAATIDALGLVKFDNSTIKMNESQQLYVAKVSTDTIEMGVQELILNGGSAIY